MLHQLPGIPRFVSFCLCGSFIFIAFCVSPVLWTDDSGFVLTWPFQLTGHLVSRLNGDTGKGKGFTGKEPVDASASQPASLQSSPFHTHLRTVQTNGTVFFWWILSLEAGGTKRPRWHFPACWQRCTSRVIIPFFSLLPTVGKTPSLARGCAGLLLSHEPIIDRLRQPEVDGVWQLMYVTRM